MVNNWDRSEEVVLILMKKGKNKYVHNVVIPSNVTAFSDLKDAIGNSKVVVLSIPSHAIREICSRIKKLIHKEAIIVNIAKGIEEGSSKRLSQVIEEEIPNNPIVILSGPSHAEEVALDIPTTVVVSSNILMRLGKFRNFYDNKFRLYTNDD
jgi:glycerol-3-phosphate dehydrogenase (NAD(P)+)